MAKKRKSSKPNIPQATLERVQQQAKGEDEPTTSNTLQAEAPQAAAPQQALATPATEEVASRPETAAERAERAARRAERRARASSGRDALRSSTTGVKRERRNDKSLDHAAIRERLAHPTKPITEADLRRDYTYVIRDLRSMFMLSLVLFVAIIVLGSAI